MKFFITVTIIAIAAASANALRLPTQEHSTYYGGAYAQTDAKFFALDRLYKTMCDSGVKYYCK